MLPIALIIKAAVAFVGVIVAVAGLSAALVFTGSPSACVDRQVSVSNQARADLQNKWDGFKLRSASVPASVTFTEGEITSRGVEYLDEKGIDIENLQVYFCEDGFAEGTATFVGGGPNIDILIRGTLDLSGDLPLIDIDEIKGGNLPGFLPLAGLVNFIDDEDKTLKISVNLTGISFKDGEVTLLGAP